MAVVVLVLENRPLLLMLTRSHWWTAAFSGFPPFGLQMASKNIPVADHLLRNDHKKNHVQTLDLGIHCCSSTSHVVGYPCDWWISAMPKMSLVYPCGSVERLVFVGVCCLLTIINHPWLTDHHLLHRIARLLAALLWLEQNGSPFRWLVLCSADS